jgi:hypothetical protein
LQNEPKFVQAGVEILVWESQKRTQMGHTAGEGADEMLILPNEANFLEWVRLWIGLRDKKLKIEVGQSDTWLRLSGLASFWHSFDK